MLEIVNTSIVEYQIDSDINRSNLIHMAYSAKRDARNS